MEENCKLFAGIEAPLRTKKITNLKNKIEIMLEIKLTIGADSELINAVNRLAEAFSNAKGATSALTAEVDEIPTPTRIEMDIASRNTVDEKRKRRTKAEIEAERQAAPQYLPYPFQKPRQHQMRAKFPVQSLQKNR